MEININSNNSFTSRNNPIKPFNIYTKKGELRFAEVKPEDIRQKGFLENLTMFFCKNFASISQDPNWQVFNSKKPSREARDIFYGFLAHLHDKLIIPDDNLTLLVAKDRFKRIQGACMSFGLDNVPTSEHTTCYIESIAVNPKYRGLHIGKILLDKTLKSAQKAFTDVFLTGQVQAEGFYKKLGFQHLTPQDRMQRTVIDFIAEERDDYPEYVSFLTKPLQIDKPRWYEAASKEIEKINDFFQE